MFNESFRLFTFFIFFLVVRLNFALIDFGSKPKTLQCLVEARLYRIDVDKHECFAISPQVRLQDMSEFAVPVGHKRFIVLNSHYHIT